MGENFSIRNKIGNSKQSEPKYSANTIIILGYQEIKFDAEFEWHNFTAFMAWRQNLMKMLLVILHYLCHWVYHLYCGCTRFSFIILAPHSYSPYCKVSLSPLSGHSMYIKFMLVEELLTNPVLHVFVRLLRKGAEGGTVGKEAVNKQFFLRSIQSKEKLSFVYEEKGMTYVTLSLKLNWLLISLFLLLFVPYSLFFPLLIFLIVKLLN